MKNNVHVYWIVSILVCMVGMFLSFYHSPIKLNDDVRKEIIEYLKSDYDSILNSSIDISEYKGTLVSTNENGTEIREDMQTLDFKALIGSDTVKCYGWIFIEPKFLGYDIKSIKVNK